MVQKDTLVSFLLNKNHDEVVIFTHIITHSAISPPTFPREAKEMARETCTHLFFYGFSWKLNPNTKRTLGHGELKS